MGQARGGVSTDAGVDLAEGRKKRSLPPLFVIFKDMPRMRGLSPTSGRGVAAKFKPFSLSASRGQSLNIAAGHPLPAALLPATAPKALPTGHKQPDTGLAGLQPGPLIIVTGWKGHLMGAA